MVMMLEVEDKAAGGLVIISRVEMGTETHLCERGEKVTDR